MLYASGAQLAVLGNDLLPLQLQLLPHTGIASVVYLIYSITGRSFQNINFLVFIPFALVSRVEYTCIRKCN